ncbi:methyltransferase domain-containing protein, partial [Candidatus Woesearchaeota archaeon]|nr:methyltransferase domain-containing protein [Candidatus Woesearchaeota archaeon]
NIRFIKDYYSEKHKDKAADLISCKYVLEHVDNPFDFIANIRNISKNKNPVFFFEVPNAERMLKHLSIWEIIYEHYTYFTKTSLDYLFASAGFKVMNLAETFGDTDICIEAKTGDKRIVNNKDEIKEIRRCAENFAKEYKNKVGSWKNKLKNLKKTVLWGAGARGLSFLNAVKPEEIQYIVDINPNKQGKYIAGTGQKIIGPDFLKGYRPDKIIIMNPVYKEEIQKTLDKLKIDAEILCA